uniref:NADH:ubiquinone reductase (H(+)-translocating) n=1 Tax=Haplobothrium globuliforme TaxID=108250 RepID=A0A8F7GLY3_9CEST|nr:NADH dehydrogenase subunit 5 [Haplobothrium globuliforme]
MFLFCVVLVFLCFSVMCKAPALQFSTQSHFFSGVDWPSTLVLDSVTLWILLMLCVCFFYAHSYTHHYFGGGGAGYDLNRLICLFVGVMASLVLTGDYLTTLVFWEYLGVVSYFLILFYMNYLSLRASIVTLISSRFGDVCLFFIIAVSIFVGTPWYWTGLLFFFVVFTKSASFPFISWLLEAMRAPTPVSSLVHSSTLVAAGVFFTMRYDLLLYLENYVWFEGILLLTIFITGTCCFFFVDLKKIVALSTCNNVSWCVFYLLLGDVTLALFQLVSHGVSKCMLFMLVGDVMSGSAGSQASNCVYTPAAYGSWGPFSLFCLVLGLSGAPFIGVFFTKHFLISGFNSGVNLVCWLVMGVCIFLSYFYSFRLCRVLVNVNTSVVSGVFFVCGAGSMVYFWLLINYFLGGLLEEVSYVSQAMSVQLINFQVISCLTAYACYSSVLLSQWSSSIFGCDCLVEGAYRLFGSMLKGVSLFLYRWDHSLISLLTGFGQNSVGSVAGQNLLNILFFLILLVLILMCIL